MGLALLCLLIAAAGGRPAGADEPKGEESMKDGRVAAVLERHRDELMALPGVTGVAEGRCGGSPCIKVYVTDRKGGSEKKIPSSIEGLPVSVEETGEFRKK